MNKLYQMLAIEKKNAWIEEEPYREILKRHGASLLDGKYSAKTMSEKQIKSALREIRSKKAIPQNWRTPRIQKIRSLWLRLADAGVVRDASNLAMNHWCAKVCKVERLEFARAEGLNKCIEGLKSWAKRENIDL